LKKILAGSLFMTNVNEVLEMLRSAANVENLAGMARYGINPEKRLGVKVPQMRQIAKTVGRDHQLALDLWETGIPEAMVVASIVDEPELVTKSQMDKWVADFNSWDVCDQVCMNLFDKTNYSWDRIEAWHERQPEFVRRAAYALIACLAWHDKSAPDEKFIEFIPLIEEAAVDERNYVKKAVSWALRNIGKRNQRLHQAVLETAQELIQSENKTARWIGKDTVKDITSPAVQKRLLRMGQGEI